MGHHGIRPHACNVARGNEKGRVEDAIKYIRNNFWAGRTFTDFEELTKQTIVWRNQFANQREHRSTKRVVKLFFESEEKPALLPLNPTGYDTDEVFSKTISPDFHIQYETNRYSVPWTLVGMVVTVRLNDQYIKIFYNEKFITSHKRSYLKNKVFTIESHKAGLIERKPGATRDSWQLSYVKNLGPKMSDYVNLIKQGHRSLRFELTRIIALVTVYGAQAVTDAVSECLANSIVGVDSVEIYLRRHHHPAHSKLSPEPIQFENERYNREVPVIDLRQYDVLLFGRTNNFSTSEDITNGPTTTHSNTLGAQAQTCGPSNDRRVSNNEYERTNDNLQVLKQVDDEGKSRTTNTDDTKQNQNSQVSSASDH